MEAQDEPKTSRRPTEPTFEGTFAHPTHACSYKPRSLRWPFLLAEVALLLGAIAIVLLLLKSMPNSDSTAFVDGKPMVKLARGLEASRPNDLRRAKRQVFGGGGFRPGQIPKAPAPFLASNVSVASTSLQEKLDLGDGTKTTTAPPSGPPEAPDFLIKGGVWSPGAPLVLMTRPAAVNTIDGAAEDKPENVIAVTALEVLSGVLVGVIKGGGGRPGAQPGSAPVVTTTITFGSIRTIGGGFRPTTLPKATPPPKPTLASTAEEAVSTVHGFAVPPNSTPTIVRPTGNLTSTTEEVVRWSSDYVDLEVGPTTVAQPLRGPAILVVDELVSTAQPAPETQTFVTTLPGFTTMMLVTPSAETVVSAVESVVVTELVAQPATTVLTTVDGVLSTVVSTPLPGTLIKTIEGAFITEINTKPVQTIMSTIERLPLTLVAVITPARPTMETVTSFVGGVVGTVRPQPVTITTESNGRRVTVISTPAPYVTTIGGTPTTFTRLNINPLQTITTVIPIRVDGRLTSVTMVLTPTPTAETGHPGNRDDGYRDDDMPSVFPSLTHAQYFAGAFLPTLIAVILTLPITAIDLNAKLLQPFHVLAQSKGSSGMDSIMLRFGGLHAIMAPIRQLRQGHGVPVVTTILLWLSWLLAPLSSEAIGIKVHGSCSHLSITGCAIAVGVSMQPAYALIAVMGVMVALLFVLLALLRDWDTGVPENPWSLASIGLLARDRRLRDPLIALSDPTEKELDKVFSKAKFHLGVFPTRRNNGEEQEPELLSYGIIPTWPEHHPQETPTTPVSPSVTIIISASDGIPRHHIPFRSLTFLSRTGFTLLLLALIVVLTAYHLSSPTSPLELFLDSQTFGVKFLFAALGSTVSFLWAAFAHSLAAATLFKRMHASPQPASTSIHTLRHTDAVSGIIPAFRERYWTVLAVSCMAVLCELLPVVLSNVPYSLTQTRKTHDVCLGLSVGIMSGMVMLLVGTMWMRWPHMPVDPRTLGGCIWYVADSEGLIHSIQRRAVAERESGMARNRTGNEQEFFYGRVIGSCGRKRMVVDVA